MGKNKISITEKTIISISILQFIAVAGGIFWFGQFVEASRNIKSKVDSFDLKFDNIEKKLDNLNGKLDGINFQIGKHEGILISQTDIENGK